MRGQRFRKQPSRAEAALRNERVTRNRVEMLEKTMAVVLAHLGLGLEKLPDEDGKPIEPGKGP